MTALKSRIGKLEERCMGRIPRRVACVFSGHHDDDTIHAALMAAGINPGWDGALVVHGASADLSVRILSNR